MHGDAAKRHLQDGIHFENEYLEYSSINLHKLNPRPPPL